MTGYLKRDEAGVTTQEVEVLSLDGDQVVIRAISLTDLPYCGGRLYAGHSRRVPRGWVVLRRPL